MIVYSGRTVAPRDSDWENNTFPDLFSIGVSLGRIPRFAGHTKHLYTVLPHVLTVATIMPQEYSIYGLLHDAPEACCADVPTPWKTESAKERELDLYERIVEGHGLVWPIPAHVQAEVDKADHLALEAEAHAIGHPSADVIWPNPDPKVVELTEFHMQHIGKMTQPDIAGNIYQEAFASFGKRVDKSLVANCPLFRGYTGEDCDC